MNFDTNALTKYLDLSGDLQSRVIQTIAVVIVVIVLKVFAKRMVSRHISHVTKRYYYLQVATYVIYVIGAIMIARLWFVGLTSVVTFLGLVGAGLMIAMNDSISSLVGFGFILWRRPFIVGDRIKIGEFVGDVIDIAPFQFLMMEAGGSTPGAQQSTGRILHMPNNKVMKEPLVNYTKGFQFMWHEIKVTITFESNWEKARSLLGEIVERHALQMSAEIERQRDRAAQDYMILFGTLTPIVYVHVCDFGVDLVMRYLVKPKAVRRVENDIWIEVLRAFAAHDDVDFAYPTTRLYSNYKEGKPGARANV